MNNKIKKYLFFTTLAIFCAIISYSLFFHSRTVVGASWINERDLSEYTYNPSISPTILLNGYKAPVDKNTKTIYISQNITETFTIENFKGALSIEEGRYSLRLVEDEHYNDLYTAMRDNYKFKLVVLAPSNTYTTYDMVFTSLPVISLNSEYLGLNEENKATYSGEFNMFNSLAGRGDGYKIESTPIDYHVRGGSSAAYIKKPYKLNFKDIKGNNEKLSLLDMGEDDDWVLSPLYLDDVKIREQVAMNLWAQIYAQNLNNTKMSTAHYVEVVQNGEYLGVYLLQRRLDKKYLGLNKTDTLFKVTEQRSMEKNLEVVESPIDPVVLDTYIKLEFTDNQYVKHINIKNYIDVNIMIQLGAMYDNTYKNRYFLIGDITDTEIKVILWDTDMSFGLNWENGFVYRYDQAISDDVNQAEHELLLQYYPDLNVQIANRYFELRKSVLTNENIHQIADKYYSQLTISSSLIRDVEVYGVRYENQDTIENFHRFIDERLQYLDNYYRNWNS